MINGHININFVNTEMLAKIKFAEHNHVLYAGGIWDDLGVPVPDFPYDGPWVYQSFGGDCPTWAHQIKDMFSDKLECSTVAVNLVKPGHYIPPHKDKFYKLFEIAKKNKLDLTNKEPVRINLFLQNHKLGHFFEMNNDVCMNYKKGDYTIIKFGQLHSVINIGNENRYTLQVSGFADKGTFL